MSLRFELRVASDRYSEFCDAATRGAPIAQTNAGKLRAIVGNTTDIVVGSAAVALSDNPVGRVAMGGVYIARASAALVGAIFSGANISFVTNAACDPEVASFNRARRLVSAAVNFTIGSCLLAGFAGRDAALLSAQSGAVDLIAGPLLERVTRPTDASIDELVQTLANPASERHARVAAADLELLGAKAMPALARLLPRVADGEPRERVTALMQRIDRFYPADLATAT